MLLLALLAIVSSARPACGQPPGSEPPDTLAQSASPLQNPEIARDSIASFPPPRVRAWQVGLARGDRLEHASLSFALASAVIIATRNRAAGAATALAFGLGKELWDGRRGHFDPVDLAADAVGVGLATVLVEPRGP